MHIKLTTTIIFSCIFIVQLIYLQQNVCHARQSIMYGKFITYQKYMEIEKDSLDDDVKKKLGEPDMILQVNQNHIWIYYFASNTNVVSRNITRFLTIRFSNKKVTKVDFFF